nr:hypothetical protein 22 [Burkholderiaceae bacterium]
MAESVKERCNALANGADGEELARLLGAVVDSLQAVSAKLDADGGVTDTDYGTTVSNLIKD